MIQTGFFFDQTRCTGCYACAVACKDWHDTHDESVKWMRVKFIEYGTFPNLFGAYLASPCYHCSNPPCMLVCPENAICKRETDGIVLVDSTVCVGRDVCKQPCLQACPWDAPQFGPEENATMQKCDLCAERIETGRQPVCVEACPMFALDAGPMDSLKETYSDITDAEGFRYREKFKPSVIFKPKRYIRDDKE